jgi:hypothetical protein
MVRRTQHAPDALTAYEDASSPQLMLPVEKVVTGCTYI